MSKIACFLFVFETLLFRIGWGKFFWVRNAFLGFYFRVHHQNSSFAFLTREYIWIRIKKFWVEINGLSFFNKWGRLFDGYWFEMAALQQSAVAHALNEDDVIHIEGGKGGH